MVVATLVLGLKDDSRVKMFYSKSKITTETMLLAIIADSLRFLAWTKTKEATKGRYKEKSILKTLLGEYDVKKEENAVFSSIEEYNNYMKKFEV